MVVILLGPPGAGKGTQSALLMQELEFLKIATGDLLRAARHAGSELGKKAERYMDAGELVPDDLIVALVEEQLGKAGADTALLFDGFPRTVAQARALDAALARAGRGVDGVIVLNVAREAVLRRIGGRRISPNGRVYNIYDDPPRVSGICDETGEPLIHRPDDRSETILRRIEVYHALTEPIVDHYRRSASRVTHVDGSGSIEGTHRALRDALYGVAESKPRPETSVESSAASA